MITSKIKKEIDKKEQEHLNQPITYTSLLSIMLMALELYAMGIKSKDLE